MRGVAWIALLGGLVACGRIGYDAVPGSGVGGSSGGIGPGNAGRGGAGGSAGGAGGATGGGAARGGAGGTGSGGTGGGGVADGGAACPTATFGGHTYAFCDGPLPWADAGTDCAAKGMRLVRIDDAAEDAWVLMTALRGVTVGPSADWPWLGGNDLAVLGEWRWSDGALFWMGGSTGSVQNGLYAHWLMNSPTDNGLATDCLVVQHSSFWRDWECTRLQRYVCEQY